MNELPMDWVTRSQVGNVPAGTPVRLVCAEADGDPEYAFVQTLATLQVGAEIVKIHWDELERPEDYGDDT